jgi:hypothetical protein
MDYFTLKNVKNFEKKEIKKVKRDLDGRTPEDAINKTYEELADKKDPLLPSLNTIINFTNFVKSIIKE